MQAFVIMQIGDSELNQVYDQAIAPAITANGLEPIRVDKHSQGDLLKSEIVRFIRESDIIVADLTNERPNCYLEVGFAMGLGKYKNLILTAREDHNADSPNHVRGSKKIHFDLSGYEILFWASNQLQQFQSDLERIIRRRMPQLARPSPQLLWSREIAEARTNLDALGESAFSEVTFGVVGSDKKISIVDLRPLASQADISSDIGWPIGIVRHATIKARANGIASELRLGDNEFYYWTLRSNGDFYQLNTLFEDSSRHGSETTPHLYYDSQIVIVAGCLLYCANLYRQFGFSLDSNVWINLHYSGLNRRILTGRGSHRALFLHPAQIAENEYEQSITVRLGDIGTCVSQLVRQLLSPLFVLFGFSQFPEEHYSRIIGEDLAEVIRTMTTDTA